LTTTPLFKNDKLPVMEMFYSLQGEGYHTGKPAFFIRIGGCDVGCAWCDVKESWKASWHPLVSVKDIVNNALQYQAKAVVITGGEPLMYDLTKLTQSFKEKEYKLFIETSGTETPKGIFDWICLSPKKQHAPLDVFYTIAHELKVIIHDESDFKWAEENALKVDKNCKLFLQPEWRKSKLMTPIIIEYVKEHPHWSISLQTHKFLKIP